MDLGATVCVSTVPDCARCPLKSCCRALQNGVQHEIPRPSRPIPITSVTEATIAVRKQRTYLLRRRGDSERWAGLWDFPRFALANDGSQPRETNGQDPLSADQARWLAQQVSELTGIRIDNLISLTTLTHAVTRYRITLRCLHADYASGRLRRTGAPLKWIEPTEFDQVPLSVTGRTLAGLLVDQRRS
jgi:A/G-specific adenine glycosylase